MQDLTMKKQKKKYPVVFLTEDKLVTKEIIKEGTGETPKKSQYVSITFMLKNDQNENSDFK